eukprot:301344-Pelagomonas_calceolata.AAC.1
MGWQTEIPVKSGIKGIMMGTKENALEVNDSAVLVLWVVVKQGGHFFLGNQGLFLEGRRGSSPCVNGGKGDTLAQKSHEAPPPQGYRPKESLIFLLADLFSNAVLQARSPCSSDTKLIYSLLLAQASPLPGQRGLPRLAVASMKIFQLYPRLPRGVALINQRLIHVVHSQHHQPLGSLVLGGPTLGGPSCLSLT